MIHVSVIIPCFNAASWIREALKSVLEQNIDNMEIIVIDDGSTDNSADIVAKDFPTIKLIGTKNQGASKARNLGTRESEGEFIQYLDADDMLAPGKLVTQLESLRKARADVAYGDWQKLAETDNGKFVKGEIISRKIENPEIELFTTDKWCPMAAYLFRRSIVEKIGGWNENLPIIQDVRFQLDCALHGGIFHYLPRVMGYFRVHSAVSLSKRDPIGFIRDCLCNAAEVQKWWEEHGGISKERKAALISAYECIARASFENDKKTFEAAYEMLNIFKPGYAPENSTPLKLASRVLGYRNAETVALLYRKTKKILGKIASKNA